MLDKNDKSKKRRFVPEGRDPKVRWPGLLIFLAILIALAMFTQFNHQFPRRYEELGYPEFMNKLTNNLVTSGEIVYSGQDRLQEVRGEYVKQDAHGEVIKDPQKGTALTVPFRLELRVTESLAKQLHEARFVDHQANQVWANVIYSLLPIVLFIGLLWFLFMRQVRVMGKGAMSFGKSRARLLARDKNKVTFKDVAGIDEAKEEVQEIIDFLKDPKKFQKLGGRIPKGVLMVGPPGTGKTLLAKAIAGEADVPFFSISGSDFVEMFVGVGASRVRDMFEQAKKNAPCLVFIDEIDAVGRSRFSGLGGGHDEREQTLNALLVEMDGFETQEGVIIIAATNRPDVLDTALLRPGRFDRQIVIDLPDVRGREGILKVHCRNVKIARDVDLAGIARATPGFSGADLANLVNEAALLAARNNKKAVTKAELEEARDKVLWGRERRSRVMDEKDKKITAYHEAGHALVQFLTPGSEPLHKVTIIPRGMFLGATMSLPEKDKYHHTRTQLLAMLTGIMGGRIAEEVIFGDSDSGAAGDIKQATRIARRMVTEWGMSEKIGMVNVSDREEHMFLSRDLFKPRDISEETARQVDAEVRRLIEETYSRAKTIILENKDKLIALANALLEYETLDGKQVEEMVNTGKLTSPPIPSPEPPGAKPDLKAVAEEKRNEDLPGAPDIAPARA
jgi:cell division protease FtsH